MVVVSLQGGLEISTGCGLRLWVGVVVANSGPRFNVAAVVLFYPSLVGSCVTCTLMNDDASIISGNIVFG